MYQKAFSLIELVVVMAIFCILAGLGLSGYMDSLRIQRRQDAVLSLQKANMLISNVLNINPASGIVNPSPCASSVCSDPPATPICSVTSNNTIVFPCVSDNGFYCISYCPSASGGFNISGLATADRGYLTAQEKLILRATAIAGKGQDKDITSSSRACQNIYMSDQNISYPSSCVQ